MGLTAVFSRISPRTIIYIVLSVTLAVLLILGGKTLSDHSGSELLKNAVKENKRCQQLKAEKIEDYDDCQKSLDELVDQLLKSGELVVNSCQPDPEDTSSTVCHVRVWYTKRDIVSKVPRIVQSVYKLQELEEGTKKEETPERVAKGEEGQKEETKEEEPLKEDKKKEDLQQEEAQKKEMQKVETKLEEPLKEKKKKEDLQQEEAYKKEVQKKETNEKEPLKEKTKKEDLQQEEAQKKVVQKKETKEEEPLKEKTLKEEVMEEEAMEKEAQEEDKLDEEALEEEAEVQEADLEKQKEFLGWLLKEGLKPNNSWLKI